MNLSIFNFDFTGSKRLLQKLSLLLTGFLLIFFSLSHLYESYLRRSIDLLQEKMEIIKKRERQIKVVFLGDSHPGGGIKHRFLPKIFFNIAFPAQNLLDQYLLLKWVQSKHPELEYVVVQADFHIFGPLARSRSSPVHLFHFSDFREIKRAYGLSYFETFKKATYYYWPLMNPRRRFSLPEFLYLFIRTLPSGGRVISNERYWLDQYNDVNYMKKFRWDKATKKQKETAVRKRIERHFGSLKKPKMYPKLINALRKIQKFTLKNNLKIINLRYPVTKMYRERIPLSKAQKEKFRKIIKTRNSILNLNLSRVFQTKGSFFRNSDHLNYDGARALTKRLLKTFKSKLKNI